MKAISPLGVEPYVIDVEGFLSMGQREDIDFVVNLNSGATPLPNLGLVPSVSEWRGWGCFPNSADVVLAGERKDICKAVFSKWFRVPEDLSQAATDDPRAAIFKPTTMGNSQGVRRHMQGAESGGGIVEEFIPGYDVTVPVFFDITLDDYVVAPAILYLPDVATPEEWFLSYEQKMDRSIVIERQVRRLGTDVCDLVARASRSFGFQSLARFDFRWRTEDATLAIEPGELWFLEINCLPTLRAGVNFIESIKSHLKEAELHRSVVGHDTDEDTKALAFLLSQARARQAKTR